MELKTKVSEAFASHFGGEGSLYASAGRINLIGELPLFHECAA